MVHQAQLLGADWTLVHGGRRRATMAFLDELAAYGERVRVVPEDEYRLIDLAAWLGEPQAGVKVYCCGPPPLLDAVEAACASWPAHALRTERFVAKEQDAPVHAEPFEVELARSGAVVTVTPDTSVLEAVRSLGVDVLTSAGRAPAAPARRVWSPAAPTTATRSVRRRALGRGLHVHLRLALGGDRLVLDL